jgi:hypothetical protein
MAAMMAMYPLMKQAMERFEAENVNLDGTSMLTVVTADAVADAATAKEQQQQQQSSAAPPPTSVGGIGGAIGGRLGRRILGGGNQPKEDASASAPAPGRATIMTMTHEVVKIMPSVADADVAVPAGFKQKS